MTPARLRLTSVLVLLALNGLVILAWSQQWLEARAPGGSSGIPVPGSSAGAAELPLALTGLAAVAALLLSGPVFRAVLSVLQALLGVCVAIAAGLVLADPRTAARASVSTATGLTEKLSELEAAPTAWPGIALALGGLIALAGLGVALTARAWPAATSRYSRSRTESETSDAGGSASGARDADATDASARDSIAEWDALSDGADPTEPPPGPSGPSLD